MSLLSSRELTPLSLVRSGAIDEWLDSTMPAFSTLTGDRTATQQALSSGKQAFS